MNRGSALIAHKYFQGSEQGIVKEEEETEEFEDR